MAKTFTRKGEAQMNQNRFYLFALIILIGLISYEPGGIEYFIENPSFFPSDVSPEPQIKTITSVKIETLASSDSSSQSAFEKIIVTEEAAKNFK